MGYQMKGNYNHNLNIMFILKNFKTAWCQSQKSGENFDKIVGCETKDNFNWPLNVVLNFGNLEHKKDIKCSKKSCKPSWVPDLKEL